MYSFREDLKDFIKVMSMPVAIMIIVAICAIGFMVTATYASCQQYKNVAVEYEFHWDFWNGCLVQGPNGYWYQADEFPYKSLDIEINE